MACMQARPQRLTTIDGWLALARQAESTPGVLAVAPVASGSALAIKGDASRSVIVAGHRT